MISDGAGMAVFTQLYLLCVWTTWDRMPLIDSAYEAELYAAIADKCCELRCIALAIGGTRDHIHLLVTFTPTITIAKLIGEIKGSTSHAMTHSIAPDTFFKWQGAYGVITIGKRSVPHVRAYNLNQKRHHADGTIISALEQHTPVDEAA